MKKYRKIVMLLVISILNVFIAIGMLKYWPKIVEEYRLLIFLFLITPPVLGVFVVINMVISNKKVSAAITVCILFAIFIF